MKDNNKWLLRKTSGSRNKHTYKPDYADTRNAKRGDLEYLPKKEPIGKGRTWLDTRLIGRWLHKQVGRNFDLVYSDFLKRVQPKYLEEYSDAIFYYVDKEEEERNLYYSSRRRFYIDPVTNILCKYPETGRLKRLAKRSKFGYFHYSYANKRWEVRHFKGFEIIINKDETLTDEAFKETEKYLDKIDKLLTKSYAAIDEILSNIGLGLIRTNEKAPVKMIFYDSEKLENYSFEIRVLVVGENDHKWRVKFKDFTIEDVKRIVNK